MSADLEPAIRRALELLNRASGDWRNGGGDSGPLHWPTAIAFATRELRDALAAPEPVDETPEAATVESYFPGQERLARERARLLPEAREGMAWYNSITKAERAHYDALARSAVPADAWEARRRELLEPLPDEEVQP
ncbi:MAG: hypothetical protein ACREU3_18095 [Steroidobacteraceae bacterium]